MSCGHIDRRMLERFAMGEVGPDLAVHIALHVDECPSCAGAVRDADPLQAVFAACDDPKMPDDLVDDLLGADIAVNPSPGQWSFEPWVAAGLLMAAALVSLIGASPADLFVHSWMFLKAIGTGVAALSGAGGISWPLAALAAAGALVLTTGASHVISVRRVAA